MTNLSTESRIAPVEDNLTAFLQSAPAISLFATDGHPDATTFHSEVAHPMFNGIAAARFAPGDGLARARQVLAPYLERGLPFLWWCGPSTWSDEIDQALREVGAEREDSPGMWADLSVPTPARPVPGLDISVATPDDAEDLCRVLCAGFDMPGELRGPLRSLLDGLDRGSLVNLLARLDGEPVACGSLWATGTTGGLYNIATLERARGRGIGYAVTAALMDQARRRGCTQSILHASPAGRPVYERIGYVTVCKMPQYVWVPH